MNVLSLFDGMSCGQIALSKLNKKIDKYYASEIDKHAIKVTMKNFPNTIQLGDVNNVNGFELDKIDLLIGGSPCQDLSRAKNDGEGLNGERSGLFWEYIRLYKEVKPKYFLLENVVMKKEWEDIISEELGVKPIEINSSIFSAQSRRRLYWTNIPLDELPEDKGLLIKDIIYDNNYKVFTDERITKTKKITKNYIKWDLSGKQYWSQQDRGYYLNGKMCTMPKANPCNKMNICLDYEKDIYRKLHPVEGERLQNVPDNYTKLDGITDNMRLSMLGNGWTVDVIAHLFKNI